MSGEFTESKMTFLADPEGLRFHVEKSRTYAALQEHLPMVEFLQLRMAAGKPTQLWVVEAKSSSPKPASHADFENYIGEIREKLANGFALGVACCLCRHKSAEDELPEKYKSLDLANMEVRLILIIHGHKKEWLAPLKEKLNIALRSTVKAWALGALAVDVLNDEQAKRYGLIR